MNRRQTLRFFGVLSVVLALAACATEDTAINPAAPTPASVQSGSSDTALDTTSLDATSAGVATGAAAVPRPGGVDVKGLIKSIDFNGRTFVLVARNERDVDVRVTQKTVFAAGPNPRARLTFRSLKPGMPVDVVGKLDQGVIVAASVVVLKPRV